MVTPVPEHRGSTHLPPRLPPGHVRRERLIRLLDSYADRSVIAVRGPAGSGKSTLLADWVSHRAPAERHAWITLDPSLIEPEVFWTEVARELLGDDAPPVGYARLAALLHRQPEPVTIVVDNLLLQHDDLVEELTRFAQVLRNGRVVVATRSARRQRGPIVGVQTSSALISSEELAFNHRGDR